MSIRQKILDLLTDKSKPMTMKEIYTHFPDIKDTTIRGRVYDSLGKGVTRIDRGIYISAQAIIEHGDSREIIDRMVEQGDLFDFIFLDIPYEANGQRGGNRDLFTKDKISPADLGELLPKLEKLLKTDDSPLLFMFTSGKTSRPAYKRYISQFANRNLKKCNVSGTYMKLWGNGNRMNMGKYPMPLEWIHVYSRSGKVENLDKWILGFADVPDKRYPTAKPYSMIKTLVKQGTKIDDWVFDPFGGSGKILKACIELGRKCHIIDNSFDSMNNYLIPILNDTRR